MVPGGRRSGHSRRGSRWVQRDVTAERSLDGGTVARVRRGSQQVLNPDTRVAGGPGPECGQTPRPLCGASCGRIGEHLTHAAVSDRNDVRMTAARSADRRAPCRDLPTQSAVVGQPGRHRTAPPPSGWTVQMNALGEFIRAQRQLANLSLREMAVDDERLQRLSQPGRARPAPALAQGAALDRRRAAAVDRAAARAGGLGVGGPRGGGRRAAPRRPSAPTPGSPRSSARRCWACTAASSTPSDRTGRRTLAMGPASHALVIDILNAGA